MSVPAIIDLALLALLGVTAVALLKARKLLAAVLLAGVYSLLSATLFTVMDAVDVAFTEAAVGAGISTVLFLAAILLAGREEAPSKRSRVLPLLLVAATGALLLYGTTDMPPYGSPDNPAHRHVAPRYLEDMPKEIGVPNVVTAVLASYRGYDTLGETTVVFAAVVGVLILLGGGKRARGAKPKEER